MPEGWAPEPGVVASASGAGCHGQAPTTTPRARTLSTSFLSKAKWRQQEVVETVQAAAAESVSAWCLPAEMEEREGVVHFDTRSHGQITRSREHLPYRLWRPHFGL